MLKKVEEVETDSSDYEPSNDPKVIDERVQKILKKGIESKPEGIKEPKKQSVTTESYYRDPQVKAWVLKRADGKCEQCNKAAPFKHPDGTKYLETHHVVPLSDGGEDTVENSIALCPNCHREVHYGKF